MRSLIIMGLLAAVAVPSAVSAQSVGEIHRDQRDLAREQRQLHEARRFGDRGDVRDERRDVQRAKQELRGDRHDRQAYVAPYRGWNYRPVATGYRLQPAFYGPRYVIADPVQYRLAPAPRAHQWIRYGNDLLLVNVRNGRVVQVVRSRY